MPDFKSIEYLKTGNKKQKLAFRDTMDLDIFNPMKSFNPVLTGTIPVDIDLPNSDLDIVCECSDHHHLVNILKKEYGDKKGFTTSSRLKDGLKCTRISSLGAYFEIEILVQDKPVEQQNAYRHMLVEYKILEEKGEQFKTVIRKPKKSGMKTEPAFAELLGIKGDPYMMLLKM